MFGSQGFWTINKGNYFQRKRLKKGYTKERKKKEVREVLKKKEKRLENPCKITSLVLLYTFTLPYSLRYSPMYSHILTHILWYTLTIFQKHIFGALQGGVHLRIIDVDLEI